MMARHVRTAVLLVCIWLTYFARATLLTGVIAVASFAGTLLSRDVWLRLQRACAVVAFSWMWSEEDRWFEAVHRGPNAFLYASFALHVVHVAKQASDTTRRHSLKMHTVIFKVRRCLYVIIVNACLCVAVYYLSILSEFVDESDSLTIRDTTAWVNRTQCDHKASANLDESLYDAYEFTPDCAYYVWVRSRVNLLALLQVVVAFTIVVELPHDMEEHGVRLLYTLLTIAYAVLLFSGTTVWLDTVHEWYVMPLFTAVCFTGCAVLQWYLASLRAHARVFHGIPRHWWPSETRTPRSCG